MLEDMKIFHKTYEFIKWLHALLAKFPKSERWTLGQKIENSALGVLEGIIRSNNEFDKTRALQETIIELDKLRVFIRLAKDLQFISFQQYEFAAVQMDEMGRMLGGWYKKACPKQYDRLSAAHQTGIHESRQKFGPAVPVSGQAGLDKWGSSSGGVVGGELILCGLPLPMG